MNKNIFSRIDGMALLTVLLLTVLMIIMAVSMVFISTNFLALFGNSEARLKALEAAEAGVEYALYRLNDDPTWGITNLSYGGSPNPDTIPVCDPDNTAGVMEEPLPDGSTFTIIFDSGDSRYGSENNLFGTSITSITRTPPYTAKIVSIGRSSNGNIKKVVEAYLIRGDLYPYTINSEGRVVLEAGEYTLKGEEGTSSPGHIYSSWTSTPAPGNYSIEGMADATQIVNYNGMFIGNGPVSIAGTFDGQEIGDHPQNFYFSKIDVGKIVERAKNDAYGDLTPHLNAGTVYIQEENISGSSGTVGTQSGKLIVNANGTGFSSPDVVKIKEDTQTIVLQKDVFIDGNPVSIDSTERFADWGLLLGGSNVFRILRSGSMKMEETADVIYHPPQPNPTPALSVPGFYTVEPQDDTGRYVRLDLNGHDIYSYPHLMLGVEIIGSGRIVSYGKIACLMSVNVSDDVVLISGDDLDIELSQDTEESHNKGFYYALDDVNIAPMSDASYLMAGADDGNAEKVCNYYSPGNILTSLTGSPNRTGVGYYNPSSGPSGGSGHNWWKKDYEGDGIIVRKVTPAGGGASYLKVESDKEWNGDADLQFCLEYTTPDRTQINLGDHEIRIPLGTGTIEIWTSDDLLVSDPTSLGITQDQLDVFGGQVKDDFNAGSKNYEINMKATVAASNKFKNVNSLHLENESVFNTDSVGGKFILESNIGYMESILNIERDTFTVRKAACYEIE